jgi:hypothetical protein
VNNISKDKQIKEALNQQKAKEVDKMINKPNEFSLLESGNKDSLFDKVLNQVQEKNKSKKKKSKNEDTLYKDISNVLNNSNQNNVSQGNGNSNKIVLIAERPPIDEKKAFEEVK